MPRGVYERKPKQVIAPEPQVEPKKTDELSPEERAEKVAQAREANSKRNTERLATLNAIADSNDEVRDAEMQETDGEVILKDEAQEAEDAAQRESEAAEQALAEAQAKGLQAEGVTEDQPTEGDEKVVNGVKHYLTIVNGKEKWLTLAQLRETAQKVDSADEYLRAASESVKQMAGRAASQDQPAELAKDELRKTLSAAVLGDEEAIDKLASALARPSVTPDVLHQIDQRVSFKTELSQLETEQREILEHPYLGRLFRTRLNELREEAPQTPLSVAYKSIGKEIRENFPEKFKKPTVTLADKETRKRSLPAPVQSAGRQQPEEEEEENESVEQVIANMAKARGGRPVVHGRGSNSQFQKPDKS